MSKTRSNKVGDTQYSVLISMTDPDRGHNEWSEMSGWTWGTPSATLRIMEALAKKGLLDKVIIERKVGPDYPKFTINAAGQAIVQPELDERAERRKARIAKNAADRLAQDQKTAEGHRAAAALSAATGQEITADFGGRVVLSAEQAHAIAALIKPDLDNTDEINGTLADLSLGVQV